MGLRDSKDYPKPEHKAIKASKDPTEHPGHRAGKDTKGLTEPTEIREHRDIKARRNLERRVPKVTKELMEPDLKETKALKD